MKLKTASWEYEINVDSKFDKRLALLNESLADKFDVREPLRFHKGNVLAEGIVCDGSVAYQINISATGKANISLTGYATPKKSIEELETLITKALEQNLEIELFARKLHELTGRHIYTAPVFNKCSQKDLVAGHFYIGYIQDVFDKDKLEDKIVNFAKKNKFKFVATTTCQICQPVDPLASPPYKDHPHIFIGYLPYNAKEMTIYFFTQENFQKYKKLAKI